MKAIGMFLFFLGVGLLSCINKNEKDHSQPVKEYNNKGKLVREYFINSLKQRDGKYKEYYQNGNIKYEYDYLNGKPNGEQKQYYSDGRLQSVGYYRDAMPDSIEKWYYPNGNIKSESYRLEGKSFGVQKKFTLEGKLVQLSFLKDDSSRMFFMEFNDDGKMVSHSKNIIYAIYEKDVLSRSDSAKIVFYTIIPPMWEYECKVIEREKRGNEERKDVRFQILNNNDAFFFYKTLEKIGEYEIGILLNLKDASGHSLISDSLFVQLKVK